MPFEICSGIRRQVHIHLIGSGHKESGKQCSF